MFLQTGGSGSIIGMLPLLAIIVVFYFFFIRPQQKKQKEQGKFEENLKKGDHVVTTSGILATVNKIEEGIITLQLENKTLIKVMRNAISKEFTASVFDKDSK